MATPTVPGRLISGSYFDLQRDPLGFMIEANRTLGHVFRFRGFGRQYWYHVTDPEYVEHALHRQHQNYEKGLFGRLISLVAGNGLLALDGKEWAEQRRLVQPAFHRDRLVELAGLMQAEVGRLLDEWTRRVEHSGRIEPFAEFSRLALAIISRALFSVDVSGDADAFGHAFTHTLAYLNYRTVHPFAAPLWVPTPRNRRYRRAVRTMNGIMTPFIASRRRQLPDRPDLLSTLMAARDDQGVGLSDDQLRGELRTLLTAGHETTAATLFWCMYLLARHPEQESRLHAEVDRLTAPPSFDDVPRLPFTRMIIDETMRLYPSVPWMGRVTIGEDEFRGFTIPPRTHVLFGLYIVHRHPDFWDEPDVFNPHRFDPQHGAARARGAYLPFGLGPRQCIGAGFALVEAQIVLATIARRFRLRLDSDEPLRPELLGTLRPRRGVMMRLEPRRAVAQP